MTGLILLEIVLWNIFKKTTLIADEYSAYGLAVLILMVLTTVTITIFPEIVLYLPRLMGG